MRDPKDTFYPETSPLHFPYHGNKNKKEKIKANPSKYTHFIGANVLKCEM